MKKIIIAMLIMTMSLWAFAGCGSGSEEEPATEETTAATEAAEPQFEDLSFVKDYSSDLGFNMDIVAVGLTPEGEVIAKTDGPIITALGEMVTIADGVKDLYVEEFGNGDYYSIVMIKEDGTVSAVNTYKLRDSRELEVMDNLGGYQDVAGIAGEHNEEGSFIYVVMQNGDRYMLDPYLQ